VGSPALETTLLITTPAHDVFGCCNYNGFLGSWAGLQRRIVYSFAHARSVNQAETLADN
jgi:hypothetical protein